MMWARFTSYLIHPSIVPVLAVIVVRFSLPYHIPDPLFYFVLAYVFAGTYLFPLIIVIGLYKLKFVESIHLRSAKERMIPFLVSAMFYFLTAKAILQFRFPTELSSFIFAGSALLIVQSLFLKTTKISAHVSAASAMLTWLICLSYMYKLNLLIPITFSTLALGLVASARLQLKAHSPVEVVSGSILGVLVVLVFFML